MTRQWMLLVKVWGEKLTQSRVSVPTNRQDSVCFVSLPTGTGRGRHWSVQLHLALHWSLQNLIKTRYNLEIIIVSSTVYSLEIQ